MPRSARRWPRSNPAETFNLYHAALGRSRADWLIGMNMSRLFTLLGRQSGYRGVLPVGRVQTPTLRLVVDRDRSIADFIPVPFWAVDVQLLADGAAFIAQWQAPDDHCDDGAAASIRLVRSRRRTPCATPPAPVC